MRVYNIQLTRNEIINLEEMEKDCDKVKQAGLKVLEGKGKTEGKGITIMPSHFPGVSETSKAAQFELQFLCDTLKQGIKPHFAPIYV